MTEKLKKRTITDLVERINGNEFTETGDIIVKVADKPNEHGQTLISIYRKEIKGAIIVISDLTIRECYMFLKGYNEHCVYFAPYIPDVMALDDSNVQHRTRGIQTDKNL